MIRQPIRAGKQYTMFKQVLKSTASPDPEQPVGCNRWLSQASKADLTSRAGRAELHHNGRSGQPTSRARKSTITGTDRLVGLLQVVVNAIIVCPRRDFAGSGRAGTPGLRAPALSHARRLLARPGVSAGALTQHRGITGW